MQYVLYHQIIGSVHRFSFFSTAKLLCWSYDLHCTFSSVGYWILKNIIIISIPYAAVPNTIDLPNAALQHIRGLPLHVGHTVTYCSLDYGGCFCLYTFRGHNDLNMFGSLSVSYSVVQSKWVFMGLGIYLTQC